MRATHLQVEYLTEPLGLGNPKPRFYWNCEGGMTQTAYQIICTRAGKNRMGQRQGGKFVHDAYRL